MQKQEIFSAKIVFNMFFGASILVLVCLLLVILVGSINNFGAYIFSLGNMNLLVLIFLILIHFSVNFLVVLAIFQEAISRIFALVAYSPVFALITAYLILHEQISLLQLMILIVCIFGLTLIIDPHYYVKESNWKNLVIMLAIPFIFGLQNTLFKEVILQAITLSSILSMENLTLKLVFVISTVGLIIFASACFLGILSYFVIRRYISGSEGYIGKFRKATILLAGFLFALASMFSFLALNLEKVAFVVTIITFQSVIPIFYGKVKLKEKISAKMLLGFIIALIGVFALTVSSA